MLKGPAYCRARTASYTMLCQIVRAHPLSKRKDYTNCSGFQFRIAGCAMSMEEIALRLDRAMSHVE
jgi:hypothetical protein